MDNTAQNNSSSQPPKTGKSNNSDDTIAQLQAQLSSLQNQKISEEQKLTQQLQEEKEFDETNNDLQTTQTPNQPLTQLTQQPIQDDQIIDPKQIKDKANKERKDELVGTPTPERVPYKEVQAEFEPPQELEEWMEKKPDPKEMTLPKPIEDEFGDILVAASQVPKPNIILPMDEEEIKKGLHHKIIDSIRWLAEWCKRNILLYPKRVFYNKNKKENKT